MLKKFKILMLIIMLSLIGIISVISIWLYGSYKNRLEIVVTEVERSLFNAVQYYYDTHEDTIKDGPRKSSRNFDSSSFIAELSKSYANVDSAKVQAIIDSLMEERYGSYNTRKNASNGQHINRSIVPAFLLQQLEFDAEALDTIDSLLTNTLQEKGYLFDVAILVVKNNDRPKGYRAKVVVDSLGFINTRPILVSPLKQEFLTAQLEQPIAHILTKMFAQLTVALLLIIGLIGAFIYLLWTINRQNKMALIRKSFVNNMTHELKTPVATVMAAVEAIQRYGAKDDKVKMDRYLKISQQELAHLANMIEKVLQLDIDEVKGLVMQSSKVNVITLLEDVMELSKLGAQKSVNFNFTYTEDPIVVAADVAHLKNVFSNLFDNAIKYSKGSVQIDITLFKRKDTVVVEIKDYGIGIASNYLGDIFEMFFRVPNGELHPVKGFGLGLAYVKQVMVQHGGSIQVRSELGKETVFILTLPQ